MDPNAKVAYHDLEEVPGSVGAFKLTSKVNVTFTWGDDNAKDKHLSAACFIPAKVYAQDGLCACIWSVRWCAQGLGPIRPFLVLLTDVTLEASQALRLASTEGSS